VDDGSVAADKPLAVILAERKAEKDAAFQEQWKQMKTGAGRPHAAAAARGCGHEAAGGTRPACWQ
jgi:hypothetical protein